MFNLQAHVPGYGWNMIFKKKSEGESAFVELFEWLRKFGD